MELTETIEDLNKRLIEHFGIDTLSSKPIWRIVWSEDQYEWRFGTYDDITPAGLYLRTVTETRYVPKYRQWIQKKYVLERLVIVPEVNKDDLPSEKMSYEPIWVFEDKNGNYLPPKWEPAKWIIDCIYAVQYGDHSLKRYKDPKLGSSPEEALAIKNKEIDQLTEELFGEQSGLMGTTYTGGSVIVPRNYEKRGDN